MRYYEANISDPDTGAPIYLASLNGSKLSSLLPSGSSNPQFGTMNAGALQVEFDLVAANQTDPDNNSYLRISGIGIADLSNAKNFNGKNIEIRGGMSKGLPLANPKQAGTLVTGMIAQAFGNWVGTQTTLDFIIVAGGEFVGSSNSPGNFPFIWQPNTQLSTAIANTLSTGMPGFTQEINISSKLVVNYPMNGQYPSFQTFADMIGKLSRTLLGYNYLGVQISIKGKTIVVTDGTVLPPNQQIKKIVYTDLIGQPTWIAPLTISVKTVLRADIHVGDFVSLPEAIATTTGAAYPAYADNPSRYGLTFQGGTYQVQQVHHFGSFRQPDAASWNTTFQMTPVKLG